MPGEAAAGPGHDPPCGGAAVPGPTPDTDWNTNLAAAERVLPPDHPDLIFAWGSRGTSSMTVRRYGDAVVRLERVCADGERILARAGATGCPGVMSRLAASPEHERNCVSGLDAGVRTVNCGAD